jgi:hypothetical protein
VADARHDRSWSSGGFVQRSSGFTSLQQVGTKSAFDGHRRFDRTFDSAFCFNFDGHRRFHHRNFFFFETLIFFGYPWFYYDSYYPYYPMSYTPYYEPVATVSAYTYPSVVATPSLFIGLTWPGFLDFTAWNFVWATSFTGPSVCGF